MNAGSIDAVLTLNSEYFQKGLDTSLSAVEKFKASLTKELNFKNIHDNIEGLHSALTELNRSFTTLDSKIGSLENIKRLSLVIQRVANSLRILSSDSIDAGRSMNIITNMFNAFKDALNGTEVKLKGGSIALKDFTLQGNSASERTKQLQQHMANLRNSAESSQTAILQMARALNSEQASLMTVTNATEQYAIGTTNVMRSMEQLAPILQRNSQEMTRNAEAKLRAMGYTGELSSAEQRLAQSTNTASSSILKESSAMTQASANATRMTSATNGLAKAMSSLRMIGSLVSSMLVWNFASSLINATRETVNAKSEMEGYFQMLNFSRKEIDGFNATLDQTVQQFQRVNKYSLGETIASIGVEFNLTTQEMEKAMKVTSMVTSEYLRAGRNANEASLAVKDVLQGQFQRLSRETGVKGEQLKEAGWSGDTNDVMGLMEALEKVAESRNWDVFAEKANSLNDIVTILQNRFGEWSADMVYAVQPAIVGAFNSMMSVAEMFGGALAGAWEWLTSDGWGQSAIQIGLFGTALLGASQMLLQYRSGLSLVEASQMGLKESILSLILGLKGQEVAEIGVRNSIMAKILGVNAETVAESGVTTAIHEKILATKEEALQQKLATLEEKLSTSAKEENALVTQAEALQERVKTASKEGSIVATQIDTLEEEANTLAKEANVLASEEQTVANTGLIASLYALGTGEALVAGETSALSVAWGVLNGVFELSPLGWIATAILAVASAIYVLTGGLDELWGKLQRAEEAIKDTDKALEPFQNNLQSIGDELENARQKYGENSQEVQELSTKYHQAELALDSYKDKLAEATQASEDFNTAVSETEAHLETIIRTNLASHGYTDSQINDTVAGLGDLATFTDVYTTALQRHNYHEKQFVSQSDSFIDTLERRKDTLDPEEYDKAIADYTNAYADMVKYADEYNTADNWWDKQIAETQYGMAKYTVQWHDFWNGFWSDFNEDPLKPFTEAFSGFGEWFGDIGDNISSISHSFFDLFGLDDWGAETGDAMSEISHAILDPIGGIGDSISEISHSIWDNLNQQITDGLNWFNSLDWGQMITDAWNSLVDYVSQLFSDFDIGSLFSNLFNGEKTIDLASIFDFVKNNIITPIWNGLVEGIRNIPILGAIAEMLGLIPNENSDASNKGKDLGKKIGDGLLQAIGSIPIVGDILRMLGLIPQTNSDAHAKGKGVGESIKQGEAQGHQGIANNVRTELNNVVSTITSFVGQVFQAGMQIGSSILNGIKNALDMHSPSIISRELLPQEFGTNIPNAILGAKDTVYNSAVSYGQSISEGISSVNMNGLGLGGMADEYQSDAQVITTSSEMMGSSTTTAFNDMQLAVNTTTSQMSGNVASTYSSMQTKQASSLETMKNKNTTAYKDMYTKSNQSLIQMRDSTSNVTEQMTQAWTHMKDQIVKSADKLKVDSTAHFNQLSTTIGGFYKKIQNPSLWGAGVSSWSRTPKPATGRRMSKGLHGAGIKGRVGGNGVFKGGKGKIEAKRGAGISPYGGSKVMSIRDLMMMANITDTTKVDMNTFMASIFGEHGFGWDTWSTPNYNYIKTKSDAWDMKAPMIMGRIKAGSGFKVKEFEGGKPKLGWNRFMETAEALFSAIPYRFYYDSNWKGNWVNALRAGATNCSDGADALIALASVFGFGGYKAHTTLSDGVGHFYAVINGKAMDTTHFQNSRSWSPLGGAGVPTRTFSRGAGASTSKTVNVTIDMSNSTVYGIDDLESKIDEATKKAMREEFNDPYTVGIV